MPVTEKALKKHPGLNPQYARHMSDRMSAQAHNRAARERNTAMSAAGIKMGIPLVPVPKQPNKYVPHYGAKEAARYAAKVVRHDRMGQSVRWTSSNTPKHGVIIGVVPAGKQPADIGITVKDAGAPRDHVSYVIEGGVSATGRKTKYWPRVSLLEFI